MRSTYLPYGNKSNKEGAFLFNCPTTSAAHTTSNNKVVKEGRQQARFSGTSSNSSQMSKLVVFLLVRWVLLLRK
jgi:hypothetical protein